NFSWKCLNWGLAELVLRSWRSNAQGLAEAILPLGHCLLLSAGARVAFRHAQLKNQKIQSYENDDRKIRSHVWTDRFWNQLPYRPRAANFTVRGASGDCARGKLWTENSVPKHNLRLRKNQIRRAGQVHLHIYEQRRRS